MGYDEFMKFGKKALRPVEHAQIVDQMQMELCNAEMLVAGILKNEAHLYQVGEAFAVAVDNFGTIGTGGDLASRWLHWRNQNEGMSLQQTVLNVYEAQRFGSMQGSVGRILSMFVLNNRGSVRQICPSFKAELEKHYQAAKRQKGLPLTESAFYKDPVLAVD
jgi:hypothetical protein